MISSRFRHRQTIPLVVATTTETGVTLRAELDQTKYPKGVKASDALSRHAFHGDWNYTISPNQPVRGRRKLSFDDREHEIDVQLVGVRICFHKLMEKAVKETLVLCSDSGHK
jgi:hypothetical protein